MLAHGQEPGVNLLVMRAVDTAGNIALAKVHVTLAAPLRPAGPLRITPAKVNLGIGDSQQFNVVDEQGHARSDAAWSVSDTGIATLSSNSSPVVTALAAGTVNLIASVGGLSTQVQVSISAVLPSPSAFHGVIEPDPGLIVASIIPAVPAGPDMPGLYSVEDSGGHGTAIVALAADGRRLWGGPLLSAPKVLPSPNGDVVALTNDISNGMQKLTSYDGQTGKPVWEVATANGLIAAALRPDGAIVVNEIENYGQHGAEKGFVSVFKGDSGQRIANIPLRLSASLDRTYNRDLGNIHPLCTGFQHAENLAISGRPDSITVDSNGTAYFEYLVFNDSSNEATECRPDPTTGNLLPYRTNFTAVQKSTTILMRVNQDGSSSEQELKSDTATTVSLLLEELPEGDPNATQTALGGSYNAPSKAIPDGQGGVLALWGETPNTYAAYAGSPATMVMHQSPISSATYSVPIYPPEQLVINSSGTAFALAGPQTLFAFDIDSGQPRFSYLAPNGIGSVNLVAATDVGGVLISQQRRNDSLDLIGITDLVHLDAQGMQATVATTPSFDPPLYDWNGRWYDVLGSGRSRIAAASSVPVTANFLSSWPTPWGNPSRESAALDSEFGFLKSCPLAVTPCPKEAIYVALGALEEDLANACQGCEANIFGSLRFASGAPLSQSTFLSYLTDRTPQFFDGKKTEARICGGLNNCSTLQDNRTIGHYFALEGTDLTAATVTPSTPQRTFFNASCITTDNGGANSVNISTEFHEALHAATGLDDTHLQAALGCRKQDDSSNLTWYLRQFIDGTPLQNIKSCTNATTLACGQ